MGEGAITPSPPPSWRRALLQGDFYFHRLQHSIGQHSSIVTLVSVKLVHILFIFDDDGNSHHCVKNCKFQQDIDGR